MSILVNNEGPDEMPRDAAFHQGLHCLSRQNRSSEKKYNILLKIITCDPTIYQMDHPDLTIIKLYGKFHLY